MTGEVRARVSSGHRPVGADGTVKWTELARAVPSLQQSKCIADLGQLADQSGHY
jgi:hypothetical protein